MYHWEYDDLGCDIYYNRLRLCAKFKCRCDRRASAAQRSGLNWISRILYTRYSKNISNSMKFFRPPNFFNLFEQFQKLVAFLLPIFGNVDGSWRVTSKLRGSTLIQVARRRSKVFQRFSASLVRVGDVQGVSRRHAVRGKKEHTLCVLLGV